MTKLIRQYSIDDQFSSLYTLPLSSTPMLSTILKSFQLNESEIRSIVTAEVDNSDQLIAEASSFGIAHLLGNPQTLTCLPAFVAGVP